MGRMYACVFEQVTVSAAQDLFQIDAPADSVVVLHSVTITQTSDAGDAEAEMLPILFHRGTTDGSGGSTITPRRMAIGDALFGGTVEANNTTQSTEGNQVHAESFNVQAGFFYRPTPEERIVISPSQRLVIELQTAPADALTMDGVAIIEEIGG